MNTTLGEGGFKKIVAPVKKEDKEASNDKNKAGILGEKAEEGRGQEMPSYMIKQLITSPSNIADAAKTRALNREAGEPREESFKTEKLDVNDDKKTSENDEDKDEDEDKISHRAEAHKS